VRGGELRLNLAEGDQHLAARSPVKARLRTGSSGNPANASPSRSASATVPGMSLAHAQNRRHTAHADHLPRGKTRSADAAATDKAFFRPRVSSLATAFECDKNKFKIVSNDFAPCRISALGYQLGRLRLERARRVPIELIDPGGYVR